MMEYFEEDEEFEKIVRSVTTKIKPEQNSCLFSPTPRVLSGKVKILQQLKQCAAEPVPASHFHREAVDTDSGSFSSYSNEPDSDVQNDDNTTDVNSVRSSIKEVVRSEQVPLDDILTKLNDRKLSVDEIIESWKVVDPGELTRTNIQENASSNSDDVMYNDSDAENLQPQKETITHAHASAQKSHQRAVTQQHSNQVSTKQINKNGYSKQRNNVPLTCSDASVGRSEVSKCKLLQRNNIISRKDTSDPSCNVTETEDSTEISDDQSTAEMKTDDSNTENLVPSSSEKHITELENWKVQFCSDGVLVDGHRPQDEPDVFWHSSAIVKRLSSHLVQTASGSLYRLIGKIEEEAMESDDESKYLALAFKNGFPVKWKSIIKNRKLNHTKLNKKTKQTKVKKKKPVKKEFKPSHVNQLLCYSGVSEAGTEDDPLVVDKLPKTRSGRPIIPPLSYWTGQRVWINPNTQRVDVLPGSKNVLPELTLSFTDNSDSERKSLGRLLKKRAQEKQKRVQKSRQTSRNSVKSKQPSRRSSSENKKCDKQQARQTNSDKRQGRSKKSNKLQVAKPFQITGGVGTLKRKRQLRELIENGKKETVDDIYKNMPKTSKKIPDMTDALKDFKTPITSSHMKSCDVESSQTPFRRPHFPNPISDKKTPHSTLVTASSCTEYERNSLDRYVHKTKKNLRGRQWGIVPVKVNTKKAPSPKHKKSIVVQQLDPILLRAEDSQQDDEENSDSYFSD